MPVINLKLTEVQLTELYEGMSSLDTPTARKKCLAVYLRAKGYSRDAIADIARIDPDTVTHYVKKYANSGLKGLLENNYHKPESRLEPYKEQLKALFDKTPPHTINQAIEMIFEHTGVRIKNSACQVFLKKKWG